MTLSNTLTNCLKLIEGSSLGTCTRNILGTLMTDELANNINWRSVNNKFSLSSTPLASIIIDVVMRHQYPGSTDKFVNEKVQR
ncbi:hypothetical protein EG68_00625 [Paragonimus skrjabini miyazakii]|uniref:DUF4806 domain-containing protein n=1 Tax=Paragonimus skrjabini miyazakii TaxID=59628 RepID=A0A8S9Z535_9TREM|nr:hypothetical protein EG68_00625 [Paragonimus skrjabini miyazakii]